MENEIEGLQAIFEDAIAYEIEQNEYKIQLKLCPGLDYTSQPLVRLNIRIPEEYPSKLPIIDITDLTNRIPTDFIAHLDGKLTREMSELIGEEMIYELAELVGEELTFLEIELGLGEYFHVLSNEIIVDILFRVPLTSIASVVCASKGMQALVDNEEFWKSLYKTKVGPTEVVKGSALHSFKEKCGLKENLHPWNGVRVYPFMLGVYAPARLGYTYNTDNWFDSFSSRLQAKGFTTHRRSKKQFMNEGVIEQNGQNTTIARYCVYSPSEFLTHGFEIEPQPQTGGDCKANKYFREVDLKCDFTHDFLGYIGFDPYSTHWPEKVVHALLEESRGFLLKRLKQNKYDLVHVCLRKEQAFLRAHYKGKILIVSPDYRHGNWKHFQLLVPLDKPSQYTKSILKEVSGIIGQAFAVKSVSVWAWVCDLSPVHKIANKENVTIKPRLNPDLPKDKKSEMTKKEERMSETCM